MKNRIIGGILTAVIIGVFLAGLMHLTHLKTQRMDREEYLAKQAKQFDRFGSKPDNIVVKLFFCVFFSCSVFGVYELVAFGTAKAMEKIDNHG